MRGRSLAARTTIVTSAALICVGTLLLRHFGGYRYDSAVDRILGTPQSYDGEQIDNLVALGPDAVPAMGRSLVRGVEFPYVLVVVLGELGNRRATGPLLEFLNSFAPYSNEDDQWLAMAVIEALGDIGDPRACDALARIYPDDVVVPYVRILAAGSVASICTDALQANARDYVMARYHEMRADRGAFPMYWDDLVYQALIDVNSGEGNAILINDILRVFECGYTAMPVIEHFSQVGGQAAIDGLLAVADNARCEIHYRIAAAKGLFVLEGEARLELEARAHALLDEAIVGGYPPSFVEDARALVASTVWQ